MQRSKWQFTPLSLQLCFQSRTMAAQGAATNFQMSSARRPPHKNLTLGPFTFQWKFHFSVKVSLLKQNHTFSDTSHPLSVLVAISKRNIHTHSCCAYHDDTASSLGNKVIQPNHANPSSWFRKVYNVLLSLIDFDSTLDCAIFHLNCAIFHWFRLKILRLPNIIWIVPFFI